MNELRIYNGGFPVVNDDFLLLQNNVVTSFADTIKGLIPSAVNRCILHGCILSTGGGNTNITAGSIYYDGIIYDVQAQSIPTTSLWFVIEEVESSSRIYADTVTHNAHITLRMKMQAGSGLFGIGDIQRLNTLLQSTFNFSDYATTVFVTGLFATLRNGYDPTFRVNPITGVLEWAYSAPSHPDTPGTGLNPWRSLGIIIGTVALGTLGIFEAEINTNRFLPTGYYTPLLSYWAGQPGYTLNFDIINFDSELSDYGNNFTLLRRYVAPISGNYTFVLDNINLDCVTTIVPYTSDVVGHYITLNIQFFKNDVPVGTLFQINLNSGGNISGTNPMTLGVIPLPSQGYSESLMANDEITVRFWFWGTSLYAYDPDRATKQPKLAMNARAAYRLVSANFYTI